MESSFWQYMIYRGTTRAISAVAEFLVSVPEIMEIKVTKRINLVFSVSHSPDHTCSSDSIINLRPKALSQPT